MRLELKCDFWATVTVGPAYPLSFALSYALIPSRILEPKERSSKHPFNEVRIKLCSRVLHEFLGYKEGFVEEFLEETYSHLIYPLENDLDEESAREMENILGGYGNNELKDRILDWGFDWERFTGHKISGVGKRLVKGKSSPKHTPIDILNGITYALARNEDLSPYDPKFISACLRSLEEATEEIW